MFLKRSVLTSFVPLLLVALLAVACGSATSATNTSSTPTVAPTTASVPTVTATSAPASSGAVVQTASVTVGGKTMTILTDAKGLTLYYRTTDTATSVCSGVCAQSWPPLLFSGSGTPTSSTTLPGKLSVLSDTNGSQVAYQGHPLYTFASDTAPGQATGQAVGKIWYVATTDLASASGGASSATPTPTSSGY